ncbi:MAG: hypothetical protein AB7F40_11540, partial [Victivallaceae bacterium]
MRANSAKSRDKSKPEPPKNKPAAPEKTFADIVCEEHAGRLPGKPLDSRHPEALASLDYNIELEIKNAAIRKLLKCFNPGDKLQCVVPSGMPRHYRSTSKRRGHWERNRFSFAMANGRNIHSLLDPEIHSRIYEFAEQNLRLPKNRALAGALNYLIIRGDYTRFALIFNLGMADGAIVRNLKFFAETMRKEFPGIFSCFMYLDETRSDYYLERERPDKKVAFKKIFGPELLDVRIDGKKLLYPITAFSQINLSMLETFIHTALGLLDPQKTDTLIDLYCGYGLFGISGAERCRGVLGIDYAGEAVQSAAKIAEHLYPGKPVRFVSGSITPELLRGKLPPPAATDRILLDPPRSGCIPGVIETLAARKTGRILHIFCGTDTMRKELGIWLANGWSIEKIVPLDLFPGTMNLETL